MFCVLLGIYRLYPAIFVLVIKISTQIVSSLQYDVIVVKKKKGRRKKIEKSFVIRTDPAWALCFEQGFTQTFPWNQDAVLPPVGGQQVFWVTW